MELLSKLYGEVFVPDEVAQELAEGAPGSPGFVDVAEVAWIHAQPVENRPLVASLLSELDLGEAAAIALAAEREALLLIDERRGRQVAARLGLRHIGLLGALVVAKHRDLIPAVKPILDDLVHTAGFWIGPALYDRVVKSVGG
jgi:hypothetical protein